MKVMKFDAAWEQAARQPGCGGLPRRSLKHHLAAALKPMLVSTNVIALAACSTDASVLTGAADGALEAMGLKSSNVPDAQKPPREVPLRVTTDNNLNTANGRYPVTVVVRLYSLKDPTNLLQAPYDTSINPAREKQTLGVDLVSVCEMTLIPGQRYGFAEEALRETTMLGVVALFHSPASQRWKFAFSTEKNEKSGIVIGLHVYAMTVTSDTLTTPASATPPAGLSLLSPTMCDN